MKERSLRKGKGRGQWVTGGPPSYVLFVRDVDGLTCGVRCPPWEDTRKVAQHSPPVPGRYTGEVLTAGQWAARCTEWGGTLPVYGYREALPQWQHVE
ncbi:hypothetical protein [Deinococcus aluminii]|uniref:hypothetical protein n=1 Tax=Deinococcus aluminii TaxID=1656885 RepID=UPI0031EEEA14